MESKRPRKDQVIDRNKRIKITDEMVFRAAREPRYMPPYFAYEPLNPTLYAGEMAMPVVAIPDMKAFPYDIEVKPTDRDDDSGEDSDSEPDLDDLFPKETTMASPPKPQKAQSPPTDNRTVVGCRPLEGSGRKLCRLEDMDEDDKLIYYLKLAKWTEREIHNRFTSEGRINYQPKTIGTRFSRMRNFIMADNDERLKQGSIVWLEAEKKLLPKAVAIASEQIEKERLALQQRKWKLVSEYIQKNEPLAIYSGEACCQQYEIMEKKSITGAQQTKHAGDPMVAKLVSNRQQQNALLEHFKLASRHN